MSRIAVVMMAYGSPTTLEDVGPYLENIRGGQSVSQELVETITSHYAAIGGKSPLLEITRAQAKALEDELNRSADGNTYEVFVGMRHWYPFIQEAIELISRAGFDRITGICMTPYASGISSSMYCEQLENAANNCLTEEEIANFGIKSIESWCMNPLFIRSLSAKLDRAILDFPEVLRPDGRILFTAHSLPVSVIENDPYESQIRHTADVTAQQSGLLPQQWQVCFQSAGARSTRWLGPSLEDTIDKLAGEGVRNILVSPLGFVSDHIEILYDIDIVAVQHAREAGIHLVRTGSLNTDATFIKALTQIVREGIG